MAFAVFEGADGTGKSTLAENVAAALAVATPASDTVLVHCGQPSKDVLDEYVTDVEEYQPGTGTNVVADRWHLGELVYAPLYRNTGPYGALGTAGYRWVEMWLRARGAILWIVDQDYDLVQQRLATRGEDYLETHHVNHVLQKFRSLAGLSSVSAGAIRPLEGDQTAFSQELAAQALYAEHRAMWTNGFPGYVGSPAPKVVLVGDGLFDPKPTRAGMYLLESLPTPWWHDVAIVPTDIDFEMFIGEFQNLPQFVALSRDASDALLDVDMIHAGMAHPDWVRHNVPKKENYGLMLQDVAESGKVAFAWQNS